MWTCSMHLTLSGCTWGRQKQWSAHATVWPTGTPSCGASDVSFLQHAGFEGLEAVPKTFVLMGNFQSQVTTTASTDYIAVREQFKSLANIIAQYPRLQVSTCQTPFQLCQLLHIAAGRCMARLLSCADRAASIMSL